MKKVLFLLPSLDVGGMERVLITLSGKLAAKGYQVTVMLLSDRAALKDELDRRVRLVIKEPKRHLGQNLPYIRHKLYDDGMWETRASAEALYRYYIGDEHYDVEIAFFRGLCAKIVSGSTNPSAVKLAWVHNDYRLAKGYANNFRGKQAVFDAYARFDKVICVSKQAREGFLAVVGDTGNTCTIYNMLPVDEIRQKAQEPVALKNKRA